MNVKVKNVGSGIKKIIINDPKTYNSLSISMMRLLLKTFKKLDKENSTKVIILEGSGKGFSAGHNLKEVKLQKTKCKITNIYLQASLSLRDIPIRFVTGYPIW